MAESRDRLCLDEFASASPFDRTSERGDFSRRKRAISRLRRSWNDEVFPVHPSRIRAIHSAWEAGTDVLGTLFFSGVARVAQCCTSQRNTQVVVGYSAHCKVSMLTCSPRIDMTLYYSVFGHH